MTFPRRSTCCSKALLSSRIGPPSAPKRSNRPVSPTKSQKQQITAIVRAFRCLQNPRTTTTHQTQMQLIVAALTRNREIEIATETQGEAAVAGTRRGPQDATTTTRHSPRNRTISTRNSNNWT